MAKPQTEEVSDEIVLGSARTADYVNLIQGKSIGFVGNHTSLIGKVHWVDSMLSRGQNVVKVFSPEHGFRGTADAGEKVKDGVDLKTGLPIISLYGNNKKPSAEQLKGIAVLVFDIQDVGARFYTYISTLHYVMEAAAEANIPLIVLDRPNPNGHYVDGPILEKKYKSFVGMHPIPVVHGMTIGEYAQMINGEAWLRNGIKCELTVIQCLNYSHDKAYEVEISPSPNLPNMQSIYLYPSLCFFEGTPVSVGRGTNLPFQQIGHPAFKQYAYTFTPKPSKGSKSPKLNGKKVYGIDFSQQSAESFRNQASLNLSYLISFYNSYPEKEKFFTNFFNLLAGTNQLKSQIKAGFTESQIRESWREDLEVFKGVRAKYLLYP